MLRTPAQLGPVHTLLRFGRWVREFLVLLPLKTSLMHKFPLLIETAMYQPRVAYLFWVSPYPLCLGVGFRLHPGKCQEGCEPTPFLCEGFIFRGHKMAAAMPDLASAGNNFHWKRGTVLSRNSPLESEKELPQKS